MTISYKKVSAWTIAVALLMETLDSTIINTAIPDMSHSLHVDAVTMKFALTSYLISLAVFIPISGWIADRWGAKKVFMSAIFIFTCSSISCGMADSLLELVIARVIQGMGGALMMPVGRLILLKTFPKAEFITLTTYLVIPALIGPALGPVLGGFIVTFYSWRWIFFVNIPFGLLGLFLTAKYIKECKLEETRSFDWKGFAIVSFGLAGLAFGFDLIGEDILPLSTVAMIISTAIGFLILYYWYYEKHINPVINLKLFKIRTFRVTVLGALWSRFGIGGVPFLLPLLFQVGFGLSPLHSGLLILAFPIAAMISKFFTKKILQTYGYRNVMIYNSILTGLSVASLTFLNPDTHDLIAILLVFICGLLMSLQFSCLNSLCYVDLNNHNMSQGTSIASTIQQLSMSFGIAISALTIKIITGFNHNLEVGQTKPIYTAFLLVGFLISSSSLVFMKLHKSDGKIASGHEEKPSHFH